VPELVPESMLGLCLEFALAGFSALTGTWAPYGIFQKGMGESRGRGGGEGRRSNVSNVLKVSKV